MDEKFPLYKHKNGQWAKQIRGKKHYFGTDKQAALNRYLDEKDYLAAGRLPPAQTDDITLVELINVYMHHCRQRVDCGEMSQRNYDDYLVTLNRVADFVGDDSQPTHWDPSRFAEIRKMFFQPVPRKRGPREKEIGRVIGTSVEQRSSATVDGDLARMRAFLKWSATNKYIAEPNYGTEFKKSSVRQRRLAKSSAGRRDLAAADIRQVIENATVHAKPLFLLAINGGIGGADLAKLMRDQFDGTPWLNCPRMKTGVFRRIWLWPETREAIQEYFAIREDVPPRYADIAFLTTHGNLWIRGTESPASKLFLKIRRRLGISRGTYYDLRRTFQTVAEETLDFPAVKHCMGHAPTSGDMAAVYRQVVSDERIQRVCGYVRKWYLG